MSSAETFAPSLVPSAVARKSEGVNGGVRVMLRLEGAALLASALAAYGVIGGNWTLFAILFLAPDLSFAGYLFGTRFGALCYNSMHSTLGSLALGAAALALNQPLALLIALIWVAHVGFDRALGYGLKYASSFKDTHLGRIGRA